MHRCSDGDQPAVQIPRSRRRRRHRQSQSQSLWMMSASFLIISLFLLMIHTGLARADRSDTFSSSQIELKRSLGPYDCPQCVDREKEAQVNSATYRKEK